MAVLKAFGAYLPSRVATNQDLAAQFNLTPQWIMDVSGIEERRYAAADETVTDMAVAAARDCLDRAGLSASDIGMLLVASGSAERRFPGPAAVVANRLGAAGTPALDLPMASAGSLFGMALANSLAAVYGNVLVVAAEKMSSVVSREPLEQGVVVLFGDGAGACIVSPEGAGARIVDAVLHSDGTFAEDLKLEFNAPLAMNGRSVIMQASRKIPSGIAELLERNKRKAAEIEIFLMHQANQNLIDRVARALEVESSKFYSNIRRYGNTSSASMLIAAAEWWQNPGPQPGSLICFAAFGAGFHWGALLAQLPG
ncbi:MAG TPA: ketoacyl-ACP synthase III [Bryobacteraceae bacterium]|nr:ketoacyl-ACP synthase III [Bryobacteraceae bacterium]